MVVEHRDKDQLLHRLEKAVEAGDMYELETVDHSVFVGYRGDCPVKTAETGSPGSATTRSTASASSEPSRFQSRRKIREVTQIVIEVKY